MGRYDNTHAILGQDNSNNSFSSANVTANIDGSLLERSEVLLQVSPPFYNRPNYFLVSVDYSNATWNTVASHEIVTVTGTVRLRILAQCTTSLVGAGATIELGTANNTAEIIAQTAAPNILATTIWRSAAPDVECNAYATAMTDTVVVGGTDVGYTIGTAALTSGAITFHVWWDALNSIGVCAAGAGGAL